ncbi:MAG: hypothetical protein LBJ14_07910 [Desulfarculales bacterium]|nr:hypothetical protein [Desulfarculales bacterium]
MEATLEGLGLRVRLLLGEEMSQYPSRGFVRQAASVMYLQDFIIDLIAAGVNKGVNGK